MLGRGGRGIGRDGFGAGAACWSNDGGGGRDGARGNGAEAERREGGGGGALRCAPTGIRGGGDAIGGGGGAATGLVSASSEPIGAVGGSIRTTVCSSPSDSETGESARS